MLGFSGFLARIRSVYVSFSRDSEWHPASVPWRSSVRDIDGSELKSDYVWRRKVDGRWQYKQMTDEECNNHIADISW